MNRITIGIDPSTTATGIAMLKNGEYYLSEVIKPNKKLDVTLRSFEIAEVIQECLAVNCQEKIEKVVIEKVYSFNRQGLEVQNRLIGMIEFVLCELNIPFEYAHPSEINKLWNIPQSTKKCKVNKKELTIKAVNEHFKLNITSNDEADAISLAML